MGRIIKELLILGLAGFAAIYLMLPSFIPDFIPFVGWLDEGAATLILINTARYYGLDLTDLYGRGRKRTVRRVVRRPRQPDQIEEATYEDVDTVRSKS
jgi:uncharacterized membrane protein YkvA (DUF1232 family)